MFYVYEWFIIETGEIIYVGKGTKNRYKVRKHNKLFNYMINNFNCDSRIIKQFENEKDAFDYEFERINELKNQGQCICNINKGGSGGTVAWWTEDLRKQYSNNNVMKSQKQRERMIINNPMKNESVVKKVASKKSRSVIINNIRYASIKDVIKEYNTSYETVVNWCKKGINSKGEICRFEDSEQVVFSGGKYNKTNSRPVIYLEKEYESLVECSKQTGISMSSLLQNLKRGFDVKGNPCRYKDDTQEYIYENPFKGKPPKAVIINGIRYETVEEASKILGIAKTTIYGYLQGRRKNEKYICMYDNQQPSHVKSDNSNMEGSTTNK